MYNQSQQQYNQGHLLENPTQQYYGKPPVQNVIHRTKSFDDNQDKLEIIRQGYGIYEALKLDILELYKQCHSQTEYKNPADYVKNKLDSKYGPYWFVFMWEDMLHQHAQFSYYNNDDRVLEFKMNGWHILIYSFNQMPQHRDQIQQQQKQSQIHTTGPVIPQYYDTQLQPPLYDPYYDEQHYYNDPYRTDPRYPYPSLQQRPPSQYRPRWYY